MRNIIKISAIALASVLALSACQKQEPVWQPKEPQITITESNILFDSNGGSGAIVFNAKGSVTLECKSEWCTATLVGNNRVDVTAPDYGGLDGRSAAILLTCNGETIKATAQQSGMVFSFVDKQVMVEMAGETFMIPGKSTKPITVTSDDWINCALVEQGLLVNIGENQSGDNRHGTIRLTSGDVTATYSINQKFDRNFSGSYTLTRFTSTADTTTETLDVTIIRSASDENQYYIQGYKTYGDIPLYFDAPTNKLYIENSSYLGQHTDGNYMYVVKNFINASGSGYVSYSTSASYRTWFTFKYEGGKYTLNLDPTPPSSSYAESTGFSVYTFTVAPDSGTAPATANRVANLCSVRKPVLAQK